VSGFVITADDVWEDVMALFDFPGQFLPVGRVPLRERFNNIRANYQRHQKMVDAGISSWFDDDPYELGEWLQIFTPIEFSLWQDIRGYGLDLWPQLPVGRFFVDFGNPVARVAIECDGKQWHRDKAKDAARDQELEEMGWRVIRIPGWQCNARILDSEEAEMRGIEDREQWNDERTPYTSLMLAKEYLDGPKQHARMVRRARLKARVEGVRLAPGEGARSRASGDVSGAPCAADGGDEQTKGRP
jgi:very-short-patch-repair endonuclease